jgi:GxxExxY protein
VTQTELNHLSERTLEAAFRVHSELGPGLLESAHAASLAFELRQAGMNVLTEFPVPLIYRGTKLADVGYRIDLLVEKELIVEIKSLERIAPVHLAQLVSYLKLSNRRLGLLLNFNVEMLRDGIHRRVHRF